MISMLSADTVMSLRADKGDLEIGSCLECCLSTNGLNFARTVYFALCIALGIIALGLEFKDC